jgi:hypothetical protein
MRTNSLLSISDVSIWIATDEIVMSMDSVMVSEENIIESSLFVGVPD